MADEQSPTIGAQIGGAISGQLKESIKNMDVMALLQKVLSQTPRDEESQPIREKLEGVMQQYTEMSDEERVEFAAKLKDTLIEKLQARMQDTPLDLSGLNEAILSAVVYKLAMVAIIALVILFVIVFFGYKLYKSISDKEKKREEKKKAKQQKKKK